jgi:hypothetical protein
MGAYERPSGGNPSVGGCHSVILRLRVTIPCLASSMAPSARWLHPPAPSLGKEWPFLRAFIPKKPVHSVGLDEHRND